MEVLNIYDRDTNSYEMEKYFSIHDTNFRTDLKTGKRIRLAEIAERYK